METARNILLAAWSAVQAPTIPTDDSGKAIPGPWFAVKRQVEVMDELADLCFKCSQIFAACLRQKNMQADNTDFEHWQGVDLLEASAISGCHLCILIFSSLSEDTPASTFFGSPFPKQYLTRGILRMTKSSVSSNNDADVTDTWLVNSKKPYWILQLHVPGTTKKADTMHFAEALLRSAELEGRLASSVTHLPTTTNKAFPLLRQWLKTCDTTHTECSSRPAALPTRLVKIDSHTQHLRLSSELSGIPKYATLSHCWGKQVPFRLLQSNLQALCRDIPTSELSKTFGDAIEIAREMGIDYIWIDSLCIVQDSKEDWQRESTAMSDVYAGSYLNIAASSAADGSRGCFFDHDPKSVTIARVLLDPGGNNQPCNCIAGKLYKHCVAESLLASRGWVMQERFLAPRIVYFSARQLFWECRESIACETYPEGVQRRRTFDVSSMDRWIESVTTYSYTSLTYDKDKLVAISGIARNFQNSLGPGYHAGIWEGSMERQLLWSPWELGVERPTSYRAPSWSWASTDYSISFPKPGPHMHSCVSRITGETTLESSDPLGQVRSGLLRITSSMMIHGYHRAQTVVGDHVIQSPNGSPLEPIWFRQDYKFEGGMIYLLPILKDDQICKVYGLLLESTAAVSGAFRRLGRFETFGGEQYDTFMAATHRDEFLAFSSLPSEQNIQTTERRGHEIVII